jgi:hypothetical protein
VAFAWLVALYVAHVTRARLVRARLEVRVRDRVRVMVRVGVRVRVTVGRAGLAEGIERHVDKGCVDA